MTPPPPLYSWIDRVATRCPRLSRPQALVPATWSFGIALARSCSLSAASLVLAPILRRRDDTVRQRLREWYKGSAQKRGRCRTQVEPTSCFADLLAWVVSTWPGDRLALALDATTLADRLTVLAVSVVYRGLAVPVAWAVLPGNEPGAWNPHWRRLLESIQPAVPPGGMTVVLSDRGLESKELFEAIAGAGWPPLMRVKAVGHFRPEGWVNFYPMARLAGAAGGRWAGRGEAYKKAEARMGCTLLTCHGEGHEPPWLILTDLPPGAAGADWYGLRSWIEPGFKVAKGAGWHWDRSRMTDPSRAERLWLAMAVATLWVVEVGGEAEAEMPPISWGDGSRRHRVSARGLAEVLAALVRGEPLPRGRFVPEPWPELVPSACDLTEERISQT